MAGRTLPTEESLGLAPTPEELSTIVSLPDDDMPLDTEDPPALTVAKPGSEKAKAAADEPPASDDQPPKTQEPPKAEEPKMVDVRAVQEARAEAREAKRAMAILEQRVNDILTVRQAPPLAEPEKPVIPNIDDPQAVLEWARNELISRNERDTRAAQEQEQATSQQRAFAQLSEQVNKEYAATASADPEMVTAHNALRQSLGQELLAMGYSQTQAVQEIARVENQHLVHIAQNGLEIGPYIKSLAKARGWQPGAQQQQAPAPKKTDLAAVAEAQQRHQSLSDAPGGETIAPLDAKALARMSDKDFKAWMSKRGNEDKFDQIMGKA